MGNNVNSAGKILLIATGGTIACRETGHGLTPVLDGEGLLRELPELSGVCGVEVLDLMQRDSTDITADDRMQMARVVWENRRAYDGFVIAHGTDTLACTAALLHHLLPHIDRPVVVTGSMLPMGAEGSDAPGNLLDALRITVDARVVAHDVAQPLDESRKVVHVFNLPLLRKSLFPVRAGRGDSHPCRRSSWRSWRACPAS